MKAEWEKGQFIIHVEDEDIHTANERRLSVHMYMINCNAYFYQTEVVIYNNHSYSFVLFIVNIHRDKIEYDNEL